MTGHLAWPLLAAGVLFAFRKAIAKRLEDLRSLKAGSFAADFGQVEHQVDQALESEAARSHGRGTGNNTEAPNTDSRTVPSLDPDLSEGFDHLARMADDNPSYSVVSAWTLLE